MNFDFLSGIHVLSTGVLGFAVPFLFVLTLVVFFHELGHFLVARWCGVKILVFSIGFGRELFGFTDRHATRWKVAAIPLGGYVKFFGDDNAASVPDQAAIARMTEEERRYSFIHQPVGRRAAIVVAGPLANFVLAVAIFAGLFMIMGKPSTSPRVDEVQPGSAAAAAGFKPGDLVLKIDGRAIDSFSDMQRIVSVSAGETLVFDVDRGGTQVTLKATPVLDESTDRFGNVRRQGLLGIRRLVGPRIEEIQPGSPADAAGFKPGDIVLSINGHAIENVADMQRIVNASVGETLAFEVNRDGARVPLKATPVLEETRDKSGNVHREAIFGVVRTSNSGDRQLQPVAPLRAVELAMQETWFIVERTMVYLGGVVSLRESPKELGGPIRIAQLSGQVASDGFPSLIGWVALISVSIGLLNLFPIPLLDGGHLLFYAIEAVRGRPLSEHAQEVGFRIGLAIVAMLMIVATYNDFCHLRIFGIFSRFVGCEL
jgi:regulator of sigma E protease